jgi:hypothetical protein
MQLQNLKEELEVLMAAVAHQLVAFVDVSEYQTHL